jgi:hypothetical protein
LKAPFDFAAEGVESCAAVQPSGSAVFSAALEDDPVICTADGECAACGGKNQISGFHKKTPFPQKG